MNIYRFVVIVGLFFGSSSNAFQILTTNRHTLTKQSVSLAQSSSTASPSSTKSWFSGETSPPREDSSSLEQLKAQILQLGAALDRGQAYNPTSGSYYEETMKEAKKRITKLVDQYPKPALCLADIEGEWELVLTTVAHGIFRSSPFFLAIQEAYERYAEEKGTTCNAMLCFFKEQYRLFWSHNSTATHIESFGELKANLFFRLHELQTCSWGISKIGRVAQTIRPAKDDANQYYLYSEFDTSIFSLTVLPIIGWFKVCKRQKSVSNVSLQTETYTTSTPLFGTEKLLPTFGGCVITAAKCDAMKADQPGVLQMEVDYTTSRKVPGLSGLPLIGDGIWKVKVPVGGTLLF
jgi:hypothetical protein